MVVFTDEFLRSPLLRKPERLAVLLARELSDKSEGEVSADRLCQLTGLSRVTVDRSLEDLEKCGMFGVRTEEEEIRRKAASGAKKSKQASSANERKFVPPSVDEVRAYLNEKGITDIDADYFVARNTAIGWVYGKQKYPVKSWKHLIATWERTQKQQEHGQGLQPTNASSYERQRDAAKQIYLASEAFGLIGLEG